jgi:hypothetical protein
VFILPYTAECRVGGKTYENVEIVKLNEHTCWVRFLEPESVAEKAVSLVAGDGRTGKIIKRHLRKHGVRLSYVDVAA